MESMEWLKKQSISSVRENEEYMFVSLETDEFCCNSSIFKINKKTKEVSPVNSIEYRFGKNRILQNSKSVSLDRLKDFW